MNKFNLGKLACLLLLAGGTVQAADWSRLKLGMSSQETMSTLGSPLIRTAGQGFETWVYDDQAQVVFYGPVVGWTTPRTGGSPSQTVDVWQSAGSGGPAEVFVLARPQKAATTANRRGSQSKGKGNTYYR